MRLSTNLVAVFTICIQYVTAQQDPLFTLLENHAAYSNPAFSGLQNVHHGAATYRDQWNQVYGAPKSLLFHDNHRIAEHHGLGAKYLFDRIGFTRTHEIAVQYNYQFTFGKEKDKTHRLSLGISPGIINFGLNPEWVPPSTYNDQSLPAAFQQTKFNLDLGVAYTWIGLFTGYGVRHLQGYFSQQSEISTLYYDRPHHYLFGGYCFKPGKKDLFELTPQLFVASDFVKMSLTTQLLAAYSIKAKQRIWLGAGYRSSVAIQFMAGIDLYKRFRLGYAYEKQVSSLNTSTTGRHEIVLGYHVSGKQNN
jgi:type IX secretion system PorP/SprF family membrane protein